MLKLARRWAANWSSASNEELLEFLTVSLCQDPSITKTAIITGPQSSGKSYTINAALTLLKDSSLFDPSMLAGVSLSELFSKENASSILICETLTHSVANVLKYVEGKEMRSSAKQEMKEVFRTHARKISNLIGSMDEVQGEERDSIKEDLKDTVDYINQKLSNYQKVVRLNSINMSGLSHIIDKVELGDSFSILSSAYFLTGIESELGEFSAPFLVDTVNSVGSVSGDLAPLVIIEDAHLFFTEPSIESYFSMILQSIINSKIRAHWVIEGSGIYSNSLNLLVNSSEKFDWINIREYSKEEVFSILEDMDPNDKEILWNCAGGNIQILNSIIDAIASESFKPANIHKQIFSNTVQEINAKFLQFKNAEDDLNVTEKALGITQIQLRSMLHFLYNLCEEDCHQINIKPQEIADNPVIQQLCLMRLLYYNTHTETLGFDKLIIPNALKHTESWNLTTSILGRYKNKVAYRNSLKNKS